ncbi:MAG TPA: DUF5652 family protein [Candidatus Paceibacterota bacterium]|nr:DUF5652 family protein [Candidatus Paceibacterota bacterium]
MHRFDSDYGLGSVMMSVFTMNAPVIILLIVWTIFWKGLALWHAGRRGQPGWFVILLVVNTLGILEVIYLFAVCKLKVSQLFSK